MTTSIVLDVVQDVIQLKCFYVYTEDQLESVSGIVASDVQSIAFAMTVGVFS